MELTPVADRLRGALRAVRGFSCSTGRLQHVRLYHVRSYYGVDSVADRCWLRDMYDDFAKAQVSWDLKKVHMNIKKNCAQETLGRLAQLATALGSGKSRVRSPSDRLTCLFTH